MHRAQATLTEYGAKAGFFASHRWPAGNTAVPFYYGFDEQLQKTVEFLKAGNFLNVDIFALKKAGDDQLIAPLGSTPFTLAPNDIVEAYVVIQNKNIGHSLIPEVRDLYEAWVEFTVKDAAGNELYHSGFLKPDGMLDTRAHSFTNRPVNISGEFVDNHKVWTIQSMAYDNSIQAGRSALVRYEFQIPADVKGALSVTARVNYRHLRQSYLNNVFGTDHPLYPVVELASRTRELNVGANNPTSAEPSDNQDWMRWNNLAIGFLDQQQYSDSMAAFEHVVKLRPDYEDGYVNMGLTYIEWEKYDLARPPLEKALQLHPDYARALYYLALVERRQGHPEAEVADLQKVVEQFPQSRDARRELGIAYYQQHRADDARGAIRSLAGYRSRRRGRALQSRHLVSPQGYERESLRTSRALCHQANRSRGAHVFTGFSPQASGDFDGKRALAHAHRFEAGGRRRQRARQISRRRPAVAAALT